MNARWLRRTCVLAGLFSSAFAAIASLEPRPRLLWNASPSAPVGLYLVDDFVLPRRGDLVVLTPKAAIARLIEDAVGKPRGWMDALRAGDEAMESKEAAQIAMNIADADLRELWLSTGRAYAARGAQPSQAAPFAGVRRGGKKPPDGAQ